MVNSTALGACAYTFTAVGDARARRVRHRRREPPRSPSPASMPKFQRAAGTKPAERSRQGRGALPRSPCRRRPGSGTRVDVRGGARRRRLAWPPRPNRRARAPRGSRRAARGVASLRAGEGYTRRFDGHAPRQRRRSFLHGRRSPCRRSSTSSRARRRAASAAELLFADAPVVRDPRPGARVVVSLVASKSSGLLTLGGFAAVLPEPLTGHRRRAALNSLCGLASFNAPSRAGRSTTRLPAFWPLGGRRADGTLLGGAAGQRRW